MLLSPVILPLLIASTLCAQPSSPKPVPHMQAVPLPRNQISFQRDGVEITRYHYGPELTRPFLFPMNGPSGRSLTRMDHPHDPESHSHHNSFWLSHHDVGGVSTWGDGGRGRIVHQRIERLDDSENAASVLTLNKWTADTTNILLLEHRRITVQWLPDDEWLLLLDMQLEASTREIVLGKTPFGITGVRMAKSIGVNDGGGTIRNSEGAVNEKEVFWKPARWVDYSGPITATATEGITLFDHPSNPNHPPAFHVRNDGWMGASLTFDKPITLQVGKPLALRYGLYVHEGLKTTNALQGQWKRFSETSPATFPAKVRAANAGK